MEIKDTFSTQIGEWKRRSELGDVCGIFGCEIKPVISCHNCGNWNCEEHSHMHFHAGN